MSKNKIFPKIAKIEYLAKIPEHWKVWKISNAFKKVGSGTTPDSGNPAFYNGDIPWVNTSELRENIITDTSAKVTEYALKQHPILTLYPPNTLLIAMYGATIGRLGILGITACTNQACCALAEPIHINSKFCFYWLQSKRNEIIADSSGGGQKNINQEKIRSLRISAPSLHEQHLIADYLDRETTQIDNLIAAKEQMLTLLEEKREALISHAVTRGLDPNVSFKRSGLDWLGDIPQHWNIERAKNLFSVRDERSDNGDEELLSVSHITGVTSRADKQVYMFKAEDMTGYKRCTKGDFVTNTLWGWMGAMGVSPLDGIVSPDYHVYIFKGDLLPEFMELLCRSKPFIAEVVRWSKGVWSSRLRIYPENFFEIRFPVPPKSEQLELIDKVAKEDEKNKELKNALTDSISLLKERRSALITAAVTGQITLEEMTS
jgi:type I restriction enzyme S subunit